MKPASPKVSIGVVTYNHQDFIEACLDSIRLQDYPNIELIISDDASTDNTVAVINAYMQKHPGIVKKFYPQPRNLGIADNCNFILDKLTGTYVQTFAGDDLMLPHKISKQVKALQHNPAASFCFTNTEWFWSQSGKKICNHFGLLQKPTTSLRNIIADCTVPTPSMLINRAVLGSIRYRRELKYINDFYFVVELMLKAPPIYIPDVTVRYRKHEQSLTSQNYFYEDRMKIIAMFRQNLPARYGPAIRRYGYIARYAKVMTLIQAGKKAQALKELPALLPIVLTSPKWIIRLGHIILNLMRSQ